MHGFEWQNTKSECIFVHDTSENKDDKTPKQGGEVLLGKDKGNVGWGVGGRIVLQICRCWCLNSCSTSSSLSYWLSLPPPPTAAAAADSSSRQQQQQTAAAAAADSCSRQQQLLLQQQLLTCLLCLHVDLFGVHFAGHLKMLNSRNGQHKRNKRHRFEEGADSPSSSEDSEHESDDEFGGDRPEPGNVKVCKAET